MNDVIAEIDAAIKELVDTYPEMAEMSPEESTIASVLERLINARDEWKEEYQTANNGLNLYRSKNVELITKLDKAQARNDHLIECSENYIKSLKAENERLQTIIGNLHAVEEKHRETANDQFRRANRLQVEIERLTKDRDEARARAADEIDRLRAEIKRLTKKQDHDVLTREGILQKRINDLLGRAEKAEAERDAAREVNKGYSNLIDILQAERQHQHRVGNVSG